MIEALLLMGGMGVVIGIGLALASKIFYVYVDPLVEKIEGLLPGANCGGCGLPGCSANAVAVANGKASPASCVAGGADLAQMIAEAMGMKIEAKEPDIALSGCTYGVKDAKVKFSYNGLSTCQAASMLYGGMKECQIGCLGLGSCVTACPFNALKMGEKGLPVVDAAKCTGCGTCERVCPKHIITLSSVTRRILKEYTTDDCTTPCQRACPAGINISEYIRLIAEKKYRESVQLIKERNPFPTVIGRICPRPCENDCRRQLVDEPVAINFLKRFAADYEMKSNERILPFKAPETHRRIAVVGGGVEGLSTAFFSARLGHAPTVFEAAPQLGGILRTAIAQYRLPHDILDWDIEGVLEMGVKAETKKALGKDFTIPSLLAGGFEAVFLAVGGWDSRTERLKDAPAEPVIPGIHLLIDLLKTGPENKHQLFIGKTIVIAESGQMTPDAAVACKKLGAQKIIAIFKNAKEAVALSDDAIKKLKEDNVSLVFNSTITRLSGVGNALTEVVVSDISSTESVAVPADTLIIDSGRAPELIFTEPKTEAAENADEPAGQKKKASADKILWTAVPPSKNPEYGPGIGLLAKGDVITDFSAAIRAIGAGRRAAASIHKVLNEIPLDLPNHVVTARTFVQNVTILENVSSSPRQIMPLNPVRDIPRKKAEIENGFTEEMAIAEANRCLKCGLICYADQSVQIQKAS
ncbi:MAG: 4Fe-4S dicluster domain-containing protein [Desulfobacteraceae bacterium]|nr:MAG: 4Fe-4S dicluster domain-containing protein [Desulfobacteraceae bacterium]